MLDDLEVLLPDPRCYREAKLHAERARDEPEFLAMDPFEGNEHTFEQLGVWARRVRESRDRLYERLYGRTVAADVGSRRYRAEM